ncbi:MAG: GNAT family N-acetyltransferase [Acidobacteria bacterium]|nr:GNAT family N-acetyltransferase [Acidobacteriota bacterium]
MRIRPATADDVSLIHHFIRELARYEKLEHEVQTTDEFLRETLFGEKRYAEVIFAEEDGRPVGFALFFHNYSTFLAQPGIYLEDLFVIPEARGKGYGKMLLAELARIAVERKCGRIDWAVLNWNQPAIDFYASIGAVPMTEWHVRRLMGDALHKLAATAPAP